MRKLVLYINGLKIESVSMDHEITSLVQDRELINNAVQKFKIKYRYEIAGYPWEIIMVCKSRMMVEKKMELV